MPTFNKHFGFEFSPFEQYVAEKEPRINEYAVQPPYFEEAKRRIESVSTFLLFGRRGAGKSATRLTAEKEVWSSKSGEIPLIVSLTDFQSIIRGRSVESVTDLDICVRVAFLAVEAILLWITNQGEDEFFLDALNDDEQKLLISLAKAFYLIVPEAERRISSEDAMKVLHQNWVNKTHDWAQKRWGGISSIVAKIVSAILKSKLDTDDIAQDINSILSSAESVQSSRALLGRLVELSRALGFSGIVVLVDKVDENAKTQKSSEATATLVHPITSQVQLMELEGLAWIFFLWDKVKSDFSTDNLYTRLDKFAHSEIEWSDEFLKEMIAHRISYFSNNKFKNLSDLCEPDVDADRHLNEILALTQKSPRELIRLLDVVVREFNSKYGHLTNGCNLIDADLEAGKDVYVRDVLWNVYDNKILSQLLRFNRPSFTNKDVQTAFKIQAPSARGRIQAWEASGAIHLSGTRAPDGESGGKPANEYSIVDPRIIRMAQRDLYDPSKLTEAPLEE